jgi:hypothetical protein
MIKTFDRGIRLFSAMMAQLSDTHTGAFFPDIFKIYCEEASNIMLNELFDFVYGKDGTYQRLNYELVYNRIAPMFSEGYNLQTRLLASSADQLQNNNRAKCALLIMGSLSNVLKFFSKDLVIEYPV